MKVTFGALVISAGVCGLLSFAFLATSLGTDYWYIIEMNPMNMTDTEDMSSHSGLWRINQGGKMQADSIDSFAADSSKYTENELRLLSMHGAIVVMLPLSLVLLLFGGIFGLVSSMAQNPVLLTGTGFYFFVSTVNGREVEYTLQGQVASPSYAIVCSTYSLGTGKSAEGVEGLRVAAATATDYLAATTTVSYLDNGGLLTLCGASLYIIYSYQALAETERLVGPEELAYIHTSFGWSLGLAWLSYSLELITGTLLLIAAQMAKQQQRGPH